MDEEQNQIQFFTATVLEWKHLLREDSYKAIIVSSLQFLAEEKRVDSYGFVIMPNHIHLLWKINEGFKRPDVQKDFLKYTAQQIKKELEAKHTACLDQFLVNAKDRKYQYWERNPLSIAIYSREVLEQKLDYIHLNPVQEKWNLGVSALDYRFSSIRFMKKGRMNRIF